MVIMVGSFTLQLPTSASVATLLAFAKPWRYCAFGGNFLRSVDLRGVRLTRIFFCSRSLIMDILLLTRRVLKLEDLDHDADL